jgi:hypothetical protein
MGVGEMGVGVGEGEGEMGEGVGEGEGEMEWDEEYEPYGDVCGAYEEGEHEDRGRGDVEGE